MMCMPPPPTPQTLKGPSDVKDESDDIEAMRRASAAAAWGPSGSGQVPQVLTADEGVAPSSSQAAARPKVIRHISSTTAPRGFQMVWATPKRNPLHVHEIHTILTLDLNLEGQIQNQFLTLDLNPN